MAKKLKSLNPIIGTGYKTLSTIKDGEDGNIENFPDTLPKIPRLSYKRLGVSGLEIGWEFEDKIYYTYELYGSTTKGFETSEENLMFQGLASSYFYEAKPGEKWYFKARAKNTHGRHTEFSSELVTYTIKLDNLGDYVEGGSINGALIENATINNAHIKDLHADKITAGDIDANRISASVINAINANISNATIDSAKIGNLSANKITAGVLDADRIGANSITANKIEANAITSEKIQANAITTDKLAANIITSNHIQSGTITSGHIQSGTIESGHIKAGAIESDHIKSNSINSNHIQANTIQSEHIQTGAITAGSGIIAEGAIGSAQISSLDAAKIEAGTIDTSKVTIQGADGHLRLKGNRMQVFQGTGNQAKERVSLGDVNGNGSVYGLRVRGADGTTILLDENGVKSEGITDGAITNDKISDDANIDGAKLNINSVVNKINEDGTETIQGTKIEVDGTTLNTKLSTITTKQTEDSERISQAQSQITANTNAIKLKVDEQTYTTDKKDMTSKLEKNTSEISAMKGQIALKVEQADIENAKSEMEGVIDTKVDSAKAEIKVTTDAISQNVSNLSQTVSNKADGSTVTTLSSKVGSLETSVNGISGKVTNLEKTTTNLGNSVSGVQGEVETLKSDVASLEVTTSGISQKVSSVESTTASLSTQVTTAQNTANSAQSTANSANANATNALNTANSANSKIDNLNISDRNLVKNSDMFITTGNNTNKCTMSDDFGQLFNNNKGKKLSISIEVNATNALSTNTSGYKRLGCELAVTYSDDTKGYFGAWQSLTDNALNFNKKRVNNTYTIPNKDIKSVSTCGLYIQGLTSGTVKIGKPKYQISDKSSDWTPAPEDIDSNLNDVKNSLNSFQNTVNTTFKDGIIEEAEAKAISQHLKTLDTEKVDIDKEYSTIYSNANLTGSAKTNLASAKTSFDSAHASLKSTINTVISDGRVSSSESASVTSTFNTYNTQLGVYKQRIQEALDAIGSAKVDNLQIGGRNLIRKADIAQNNSTATFNESTKTWTIKASAGAGGTWGCGLVLRNRNILVPYGKSYVLSFEIKVPRNCIWNVDINNYALTGSSWADNDNDNTSKRTASSKNLTANQWIKCWVKWENTNTNNTTKVDLYDNSNFGVVMQNETSDMTYEIRNIQGELGNMPTEYTPAPEDVDGAINSVDGKVTTLQGAVNSTNSKVATLETNLNGITQRVSSTETTTATLTNKVNTAQSTADNVSSKLNNLQIGTRNLLKGTSSELKSVTFGGWDYYFPNNLTSWKVGGQLTGKVYIKPTNQEASCMLHVRYTDSTYSQYRGNVIKAGTEGYSTVTITVNPPSGKTVSRIQFSIRHSASNTPSNVVYYKEAKVESGSKATDWSPAPEDIDAKITTVDGKVNNALERKMGINMIINQGTFAPNQPNKEGELYIHGFDANGNKADVNGYIVDPKTGNKVTVPKTIINPNDKLPYNQDIYLCWWSNKYICVWYNTSEKKWKYCDANGNTYQATVNNASLSDNILFLGYFTMSGVEMVSSGQLYDAPKFYRDAVGQTIEFTTTKSQVSSIETNLNSITSRVSATETTTSSLTSQINNKENKNDRVIYAKGNGNDAPNNSQVKVGSNTLVNGHGRGLNILALNPTTLAQQYNGRFDTYSGDSGRSDFANKIKELNNGNYIIVVTSHDSACLNYATVCDALYLIGGSAPNTSISSYREAYALIGKSKLGKGNGLEMYIPKTATDARVAEVSVKVSDQGALLGVNSNNSESKIDTLTTRVSSAESKLTKDSLTTTIGNHYTTSNDVNGIVTSKGYQTQSQVQQTVNGLEVKVSQSGGYNLLRNGCAKNGTAYWSNNGGGISVQDTNAPTNEHKYFNSSFPSGIVGEWVQLKNNTYYTYSTKIYLASAINMTDTTPLHFWCNTTQTSGNPQLSIISRSHTSIPANQWVDIWVTFKTATSNTVWFRPFLYTGGSSVAFNVTELMLCEGSLHVPYAPHPSEVYDGVTTIDKDGVTVTASNVKSKTNMSANGFKITKTDTNEDVFKVNSDGTLYMKGQITVTGGSVPTSNLSGTISSNQLNSSITSDINNAKNNASSALSTANTASTNATNALNTANSVNSTVDSNKGNWSNAYNRVKEWASGAVTGTTNINGGMIATDTITAKQMAIGDFNNYSQLAKGKNLVSRYGAANWTEGTNGHSYWQTTNVYFPFTVNETLNPFKAGDKIQIKFDAYTPSTRNVSVGVWFYSDTAASTRIGNVTANVSCSSSWGTKTVNLTLPTGNTYVQNAKSIAILINNGSSGERIEVRNATVNRLVAGDLIVNGTITTDHIHTNGLNANVIKAGIISADRLDANTIVSKVNGGTTEINGNRIQTGTLSASKITTGTLDASKVTVTNLNASNIKSGKLSANYIDATNLAVKGELISGQINGVGGIKFADGAIISSYDSHVPGYKGIRISAPSIKLGDKVDIHSAIMYGDVIGKNNVSSATTTWSMSSTGALNCVSINLSKTLNVNGVIYGMNNLALARGSIYIPSFGSSYTYDFIRGGNSSIAFADSGPIHFIYNGTKSSFIAGGYVYLPHAGSVNCDHFRLGAGIMASPSSGSFHFLTANGATSPLYAGILYSATRMSLDEPMVVSSNPVFDKINSIDVIETKDGLRLYNPIPTTKAIDKSTEVVKTEYDEDKNEINTSINYTSAIATLWKAVQELKQENDELKEIIKDIHSKL